MTHVPPAPRSAPDPKVQSLVSEFIEEKERSAAEEARKAARGFNRHVMTGIMALVCLSAWLAPYTTTPTAPPVDPRLERASARASLYLVAQSVEHFRTTRGRLPRSLSEAGVNGRDVRYVAGKDETYVLETTEPLSSLTFDSRRSLQSVLGNAEDIIAQTGH